ncbi:hypothetical protein XELAEV_18042073mg [Xenopus laevis]|uniref:Uncharacterized protein n=1 Tax=Xenopus laevis TaxID=8355 RepID=A0A974H5P4_XENLA|nr:hypothetical protein XELAEV_18042073mg [Xenopus laevis]
MAFVVQCHHPYMMTYLISTPVWLLTGQHSRNNINANETYLAGSYLRKLSEYRLKICSLSNLRMFFKSTKSPDPPSPCRNRKRKTKIVLPEYSLSCKSQKACSMTV